MKFFEKSVEKFLVVISLKVISTLDQFRVFLGEVGKVFRFITVVNYEHQRLAGV